MRSAAGAAALFLLTAMGSASAGLPAGSLYIDTVTPPRHAN